MERIKQEKQRNRDLIRKQNEINFLSKKEQAKELKKTQQDLIAKKQKH